MPKPVSITIDVPQSREVVFDHLDLFANHEAFTDHMLSDWKLSGPERGVGGHLSATNIAGPKPEAIEIEVVDAERPTRIVERNTGASGRVATGTFDLAGLPDGGTKVTFTYAWEKAPLVERLLSPVARSAVRRVNGRALERLAEQLPG
jgi:polyketide cyclase/dehydrase/lipid transport protein